MGWLIALGYCVIWLVYGWRLSLHLLDEMVRKDLRNWPSLYEGEKGVEDSLAINRGMATFAGFGLATFWPVVAPLRGVYRLLSDLGLMKTEIEKEMDARRELEELRRVAKEAGLDPSLLAPIRPRR